MKFNQQPKPEGHHKLPTGEVVSDPIKGDFLAIPLFGWVSLRNKTDTPLVMLTVLLIRSLEDPQPRGTLRIELPVFEDTEAATVAALERFGWDGRVWPVDDGWPAGSEDDETQLLSLMDSAGLRATMTFPPGEEGIQAQPVSVQRARGPFLMPPLPEPAKPPSTVLIEKLQQLCANPKLFHRPMKPAQAEEQRVQSLAALSLGTNIMKLDRKVQGACRQLRIDFEGLFDRPEDFDKVAFRALTQMPEVKAQLRRKAQEWCEDEATLTRQFLKVALLRAAGRKADRAAAGVQEEDDDDGQRDSDEGGDVSAGGDEGGDQLPSA